MEKNVKLYSNNFFIITIIILKCFSIVGTAGASSENINFNEFSSGVVSQIAKLLPLPEGVAGENSQLGRAVAIDGDRAVVGAPWAIGTGVVIVLEYDGSNWNQTSVIRPSNNELYVFGSSVSILNNRIIVGAINDQDSLGVVFVYDLLGNDWVESQQLMASDGERINFFGQSVSLNEDRILIGAEGDTQQGTGSGMGAAYVFDLIGNTWIESQKLVAGDGAPSDQFGSSVSLSGNRALIGAIGDSDLGNFTGSAYVFDLEGGAWIETQKLVASDAIGGGHFGQGVSLSGDWLVVGAYQSSGNFPSSGSVYAFELAGGVWLERQKITPDVGGIHDDFGISVNLSGERLLVGDSGNGANNQGQGAAYVFDLSGTQWIQSQKITAHDAGYQDNFGSSVGLSGEHLIVGAFYWNSDDGLGAAYVFNTENNVWTENFKLADVGAAQDHFGSVSLYGNWALVGASGDDDKGRDAGAAYLFKWDGMAWNRMQKITAADGFRYDGFGANVNLHAGRAMIGTDSNVIVGGGSVYVFELSDGLLVQRQKLIASDGAVDDYFGSSISQYGDRAVIGAAYDDDFGLGSGSAYIFEFDGVNWNETQKLIAMDASFRDHFGSQNSLSNNHVLISGGEAVYVFERIAGVWSQTQKLVPDDIATDDFFGSSVSIIQNSALIGAWGADGRDIDSGAAYVFDFINGRWVQSQKLFASDGTEGHRFGHVVSLSNDQLLIGSAYDDVNGLYSGSAYLFTLDGGVWRESNKIIPNDGFSNAFFGYTMSLSDEYAMIGAFGDNERGASAGAVYVYESRGLAGAATMVLSLNSVGLLLLFLLIGIKGMKYSREL